MQEHEKWLYCAEQDLKAAVFLFGAPEVLLGPLLFHTQQCAEKALKAFLVSAKRPPKRTHDLVGLEECIQLDKTFELLLIHALILNPHVSSSRYPDSAFLMPDISAAESSIASSTAIFDFVKGSIATLF